MGDGVEGRSVKRLRAGRLGDKVPSIMIVRSVDVDAEITDLIWIKIFIDVNAEMTGFDHDRGMTISGR